MRAVSTPHFLSAQAGRQILEQGGNAVDAAVAAVAAQGVVAPETCGIGGDLFALIHQPGAARPLALNASGRAGSGVSAQRLREAGHAEIPLDDPAGVTVPGCVDGFETLISELGRLELSVVLSPAIALAAEGFEVSNEQARAFTRQSAIYRDNPAVSSFYPEGRAVTPGELVIRSDLARVLQEVASDGRTAFYEGTPGEDIIDALNGSITRDDLTTSQATWVDPISVEVADLTAWTLPPNSQGYLGPATLAVFEMLDPPEDPTHPEWTHLLIEAYRCLAWERNDLVSDPETLALPSDLLLDRARLERAATTVRRDSAGVWPDRIGSTASTAYLCTADDEGLAVSIIQSNYRGTGSPFGAVRSGFLLQDRGLGFNLMPGHPNELAPGRRPLHTLSPTLWTDQERPRWVLGTRGGAVQPQLVAQLAALVILGDTDPDRAQQTPRWTVADFGPNSVPHLQLEPGFPEVVIDGLRERGHQLSILPELQPGWGPMSMIELDGSDRRTAPDPRVDTTAALVF